MAGRLNDGTYAGTAPALVPSFNPLIFRDTLRAAPWPTMPETSTTGFPSGMPTPLPLNTEHSDMADELGQQVNAQYTVINPRSGPYSPTLLSATDYLFSVAVPISSQVAPRAAQKVMLSNAMSSAVYGMTLSMLNHYLRAQYAKALEMLRQVALPPAVFAAEEQFLDYIDDALENNALSRAQHNQLHYLLPRGVVRVVTPLGPSAAQSNALYQPLSTGDITSLSAETGQTVITVGERGSNQLRNFWGPYGFMPTKHLWFVVKPLQTIEARERLKRIYNAPQVVPWVSDAAFDTSVAPAARLYYSSLEGLVAKAPVFYVGMVLGRKGKMDVLADVYRVSAGLGRVNTKTGVVDSSDVDNLSTAFTATEHLGILTVNATQKLNESYIRWL